VREREFERRRGRESDALGLIFCVKEKIDTQRIASRETQLYIQIMMIYGHLKISVVQSNSNFLCLVTQHLIPWTFVIKLGSHSTKKGQSIIRKFVWRRVGHAGTAKDLAGGGKDELGRGPG